MKLTWTKPELQAARGCYEAEQIEELWNGVRGETVTLFEILESEININDKRWFFYNKAGLTLDQRKEFAIIAAWVVLPIFEEKRPDDKRPRLVLEALEKFRKGEISVDDLRAAAADNAAAASDAYYAAAAYDAAYYAAAAFAASDAYYAAAAYDAANAAACVAADAAADAKTYSQRLQEAMIDFVKANS